MSRWSDVFERHAIHKAISRINEVLAMELESGDAEFEDERRRLRNVMEGLQEIVSGLDPEFFPA